MVIPFAELFRGNDGPPSSAGPRRARTRVLRAPASRCRAGAGLPRSGLACVWSDEKAARPVPSPTASLLSSGYFRTDFLDASSLLVAPDVIDDYDETSDAAGGIDGLPGLSRGKWCRHREPARLRTRVHAIWSTPIFTRDEVVYIVGLDSEVPRSVSPIESLSFASACTGFQVSDCRYSSVSGET
jgi:hypothetical protein